MQILAVILTILLLGGYIFTLAYKKSSILSIGLIFLIEIVWMFVSIVYIDGGTYISEQGRNSYFTGASIRLILIYIPFLFFLPYFTQKDQKKIQAYSNVQIVNVNVKTSLVYLLAQAALFLVITYGVVDMLVTGVPLFSDTVTRSNFFSYSKLPGASLLMGEVTFFLMFLNGKCFSESKSKKTKLLCLSLLAYSFIHRILMSYKYDGLYQIFFMFFLYALYRWLTKTDLKKIFSWKTILTVLGILVSILGVAYLFYKVKHTSANPFELLMTRLFSLQAHTWWGEDLKHIQNQDYWFNWQQIKKEFLALFNGGNVYDKETGIVNVMFHVTHFSVVEIYISKHLRFYGNFATVSLNCFGYLGTAIWGILVAKMIAYAVSNFAVAIKNNQWIISYVALSFLLDTLEYFRIGNFSLVLNLKTLLMLSILLGANFIRKRKFKAMLLNQAVTEEPGDFPENIKISLCMCTYNGEQYIREQLDSIVNQTKLPDEIIVLDDASTDSTVAILNEYREKYPDIGWDIQTNEVNMGWRENFKKCLEKATGDVIFLADQDDIWMKDKLAVMTRALVENDSIQLLISDYTPFYMDGAIDKNIRIQTANTKEVSPIKPTKKLLYCKHPGCTFAITKEILPDFFACWQGNFAHDALLWRIAVVKKALYHIDYASILFRRHSSNASSNKNKRISKEERDEEYKVLLMHNECIEKLNGLSLNQPQQKLLQKIKKWIERRIELYEKPSFIRWVFLFFTLPFYRTFKYYCKDLNAVLFKEKSNKEE